jgi:hypothetical protein
MMEKSFSKLSIEQQWLLVTMLDEENVRTVPQLEKAFYRLCPAELTRPFLKILAELDEGFIRVPPANEKDIVWARRKLDWVHPSYRDLVIERLSLNKSMRTHYLDRGGVAAIVLALSEVGGAFGDRSLPLLPDKESWESLRTSVIRVLQEGTEEEIEEVMSAVEGVTSVTPAMSGEMSSLLSVLCEEVRIRWDGQNKVLTSKLLKRFYEISAKVTAQVPSPRLAPSWNATLAKVEEAVEEAEAGRFALDGPHVLEWAEMLDTLEVNEPRYLRKLGFPSAFEPTAEKIMEIADEEAALEYDLSSSDDYYAEAARFDDLLKAAVSLRKAFPEKADQWKKVEEDLEKQKDELNQKAEQKKNEEEEAKANEDPADGESGGAEVFNLEDIFSDL